MDERQLVMLAAEAKRRGDTATYEAVMGRLTGTRPEAPSGFMRGLRDLVDAPAQMLERVLPDEWSTTINRANNSLADLGLPLRRLEETPYGVQRDIASMEREYRKAREQAGETGMDWGRLGGNVVGGIAGSLAAPALGLPGVLGRTASAGIGGAVGAPMMTPTEEVGDGFWEAKGEQSLQGGLGGTALGLPLALAGRAGALARRPAVRDLQAQGVHPTPGQMLGPVGNSVEEKLMSGPAGEILASGRRGTLDEFNEAAMNRALRPIGGRVSVAGREGVDDMLSQGSAAYRAAADLVPDGIQLDAQAGQEMSGFVASLAGMTRETEQGVRRFLNNVGGRLITPQGSLSAETFKQLESELTRRMGDAPTREMKGAFGEMLRILRDQAARVSPAYDVARGNANTAWAGVARIRDASTAAPTQGGVFTPGQLLGAEKRADTSIGRGRFARGDGLLQDLGQTAQDVIGNKVPDSGTAGRAATLAGSVGIGALAATDPIAAAMTLAGVGSVAALYSPAGKRAAAAILQRLPDIPPSVAAILASAAAGEQ